MGYRNGEFIYNHGTWFFETWETREGGRERGLSACCAHCQKDRVLKVFQDIWTLSLADNLWHQFITLETPYFSAHVGCKCPVDLVEGDLLFFNMLEAGDSPIAASLWGQQESGGVSRCLHGEENGRHHWLSSASDEISLRQGSALSWEIYHLLSHHGACAWEWPSSAPSWEKRFFFGKSLHQWMNYAMIW